MQSKNVIGEHGLDGFPIKIDRRPAPASWTPHAYKRRSRIIERQTQKVLIVHRFENLRPFHFFSPLFFHFRPTAHTKPRSITPPIARTVGSTEPTADSTEARKAEGSKSAVESEPSSVEISTAAASPETSTPAGTEYPVT